MFEDSTFESTGRIRTRSRGWMIATFFLNGSILLALILFPLIYPDALPQIAMIHLIAVPPPPMERPKPVVSPEHAVVVKPQFNLDTLTAPPSIPKFISTPSSPETLEQINVASMDEGSGIPGGASSVFRSQPAVAIAPAQHHGPILVSSGVMTGQLIYRVTPVYPAIGRAVGAEGTVTLQAVISKTGTIENLRVIGGPPMLQQAALDAVKQWRYRPYQLNGQPIEVETTVSVVFTLGR